MKRLFAILVAVAVAMCSCSKIFDTSVLERNIVELKDRVTALEEQCKQMNTNISSLQTIVTALQNNDYVTGVAPITQNGVEIGYTISFSKSGSITIYHGKDGSNGLDGSDGSDGSDGASGSTPVVGVKQDTDGVYYWTLNGEWLLNDSGEKVKAISTDGKDGEDGQDGTNGKDGKDGITPQLKIENGYWYVSYNNGESWESLGKATGDNGQDGANGADGAAGSDGDSFFQSVTQDENNVIFTLADGTVITVPKSSSYLFNKLQSVSYVPKFSDGKATVYYSAASNSQVEMDFEVSPKDAVEDIAAQWETILSLKAVNTQTRAVTYIDMPILGCTADAQHGVITITASGKNLAANFFSGEQTVSARLGISDGNTNITSEYIELFAAPAVEPFSNEIWYASTDGNIVEPYRTDGFGANIVSNTYENGKGVITFDGDVTKIGVRAFEGNRTSLLKSIIIPDGVTSIEDNAFRECLNLTTVTIPESVSIIDTMAFFLCHKLSAFYGKFASADNRCLIIDDTLVSFAPSGLVHYTIPTNVCTIDDYTFYGYSQLENIIMPENLQYIGRDAFFRCNGLTTITIPNSVISIGESAFCSCDNLSTFYGKFASDDGRCLIVDGVLNSVATFGLSQYTIPNDVTVIGEYTFEDCQSLQSITISNSVTSIERMAFYYCNKLTTVYLSEELNIIGDHSFAGCKNLISLDIPDSVTTIGSGAFSYCCSLTSVIIPDNITSMGDSIFSGCDSLVEFIGNFVSEDGRCIIIDGNLNSFAPANITEYTIPNNVVSIGRYAFLSCDCLLKITIPDSVTEIGYRAFSYCDSLTSVFCERTTPPAIEHGVFESNADNRKIYVPAESVDAYKSADGWKDYADAIEPYDFSAVSE